MPEIIQKFWLLGGWFYLSLILALVIYFVLKKRFRKYLATGLVLVSGAFALVLSFQEISKEVQIELFLKSVDEKQDAVTFNQYSFAKGIREVLPQGANGCIYWSHDLPTLYLQKELYPHRFGILQSGDSNSNCAYIISQFKKIDDPKFSLFYQYQDNYLYKMKSIQ